MLSLKNALDASLGGPGEQRNKMLPHTAPGFQSRRHSKQSYSRRKVILFAAPGESQFFLPKRKREDWDLGPNFDLSREEAVQMQLQALQDNNMPYPDHGIEVLYRFANFDPFTRSQYFGRPFDLGQFERFRRIFHTPCYKIILSHQKSMPISHFEVSELMWKQRIYVKGVAGEECIYEFTMAQHLGGRFDGYWFTQSLICDDVDEKSLIV